MAAMPDTESDHHHRDDAADVARLDLVAPLAAPASSSSSSCDATTATATATARDEDEEDDGFTFAAVDDSIPRVQLQDANDGAAFFPDARIIGSPVYPVFGRPRRSLSLPKQQQQDEVEEEEEDSAAAAAAGTATVRRRRVPLGRLLLEDRWSDSAPSASGQQQQPVDAAAEAELDDDGPADYCLWSPGASPARRRKSGSTGSPVLLRWRRRVVDDGFSDGKDRFAFMGTSSDDDRIGAGKGHGWTNRGNDADKSTTTTSFFSCKQDLVDLVVSAVTCRRRCYLF